MLGLPIAPSSYVAKYFQRHYLLDLDIDIDKSE